MSFTRGECHGPAQRTLSDYNSSGGVTDPLSTAHAPDVDRAFREIAEAIRLGPEAPSDPLERARVLLEGIEGLRDLFTPDAVREACEFEGQLRAGRPREPEPARADADRMNAAKAAMGAP